MTQPGTKFDLRFLVLESTDRATIGLAIMQLGWNPSLTCNFTLFIYFLKDINNDILIIIYKSISLLSNQNHIYT